MAVDIGTAVEALVTSAVGPKPLAEEVRADVIDMASQDVIMRVPETSVEEAVNKVLTPVAESAPETTQVASAAFSKAFRLLLKGDVSAAKETAKETAKSRVGEAEKRIFGEKRPDEIILPTGEGFTIPPITDDQFNKLKDTYKDIKGENIFVSKAKKTPVLGEILGRSDENYKKIIEDVLQSRADLFDTAKRGVMSFSDALESQKSIDINKTIRFWLDRKPGDAAKAEEVIGGTLASIKLFEEARSLWLKVKNTDIEKDQIEFGKKAMALSETFFKVYSNVSGDVADAARKMNFQGQMSRSLDPRALPQDIEKFKFTIYGKDMNNAKDALEVAEGFQLMAGPYQAKKFIQNGLPERTVNYVVQSAINALFTSPTTHALAIGGNAAMLAHNDTVTLLASAIGRARISGVELMGGKPNLSRVTAREALDQLKVNYEHSIDALWLSGKAALTGDTATASGSKFDFKNQKTFGLTDDVLKAHQLWKDGDISFQAYAMNYLAMSQRIGFRALNAEDAFFKALAFRKKIIAESHDIGNKAYDAAKAAGKSEDEAMAARFYAKNEAENNPTTSMIKNAEEAALYMTFQTPLTGRIGKAAEALNFPLLKLWFPIISTPTNILKVVNEGVPVAGLANKNIREGLLAGGRDFDIAMSKITLGATTIGLSAMLAAKYSKDGGEIVITGNGPTDKNQRRTWLQKYAPYSICRRQEGGNYDCNQYNRMEPTSALVGMGADLAYIAANTENKNDTVTLAIAAIDSQYNYIMTTPWLDGANKISNILKRNDSEDVMREFAKTFFIAQPLEALGQAATPLLPTGAFGRSIVRGMEPKAKEKGIPPKGFFGEDLSNANPALQGFYEAANNIIANTPGLSDKLPKKLNMWGEDVPVGNGNLNDVWNPWRTQRKEYNSVVDEVIRLKQYIPEFDRKKGGMEINSALRNKWIVTSNIIDMAGRLPGDDKYKPNETMLDTLKKLISPDNKAYWNLPDNKEQAFKLAESVVSIEDMARVPTTKKDRINFIVSSYRRLALQKHVYTDEANGGLILKRHALGGKADETPTPTAPGGFDSTQYP